jgi:hypothetical protein
MCCASCFLSFQALLFKFSDPVDVDGAMGDGQLAKELGDLGGQEGWRLGIIM